MARIGDTRCQPEAAPVRQPTATPWRVHGLYPEEIYATDDGHRYMVTEVCGAGTTEQDKANAAFIVEAVNSYDAFKRALEEIAELGDVRADESMMIARKALATSLEQSGSGK